MGEAVSGLSDRIEPIIFEDMMMIQIDLIALGTIPDDFVGRGIDWMTDDVIEAALTEYFGDEPQWSDDLLPWALASYKTTRDQMNAMREFTESLVAGMMGGGFGGMFR